jgi:predicted trehalose synthase
MAASEVLPQSEQELRLMLRAYLLNHAVHEIGVELAARPDWLHVPLRGILSLLDVAHAAAASTAAPDIVT